MIELNNKINSIQLLIINLIQQNLQTVQYVLYANTILQITTC